MTPFQAATHPDPYGYYQQLRQHSELWFDPGLGLWIASAPGILSPAFHR